ncbi:hypothetical protein [Shewanella halifaxensis]|uniref:hypothetical protein n=1 Tax=Shewanella halifaxensis TaxID=271098 RepID=UPI000D58F60C|nr:hypothetical protein [Shewanella halifaxensis]
MIVKFFVDGVDVGERPTEIGTQYREERWLNDELIASFDSVVAASEQLEDHKITRLAFFSRLTHDELVAIDLASIGATVEAATVRSVLLIANAASYVELTRPDTIKGVNALVTLNLLTQERATAILEDEIQEIERPL